MEGRKTVRRYPAEVEVIVKKERKKTKQKHGPLVAAAGEKFQSVIKMPF